MCSVYSRLSSLLFIPRTFIVIILRLFSFLGFLFPLWVGLPNFRGGWYGWYVLISGIFINLTTLLTFGVDFFLVCFLGSVVGMLVDMIIGMVFGMVFGVVLQLRVDDSFMPGRGSPVVPALVSGFASVCFLSGVRALRALYGFLWSLSGVCVPLYFYWFRSGVVVLSLLYVLLSGVLLLSLLSLSLLSVARLHSLLCSLLLLSWPSLRCCEPPPPPPPVFLGIPGSDLPDSRIHPARFPLFLLAFPWLFPYG